MVSEWMVSVFERPRTSLCLKFFAKPFWDLNLGLAIKTQSRGLADKNASLSRKCKKNTKKVYKKYPTHIMFRINCFSINSRLS